MNTILDDIYYIPVMKCEYCGKLGPMNTVGPFVKEGLEDIYISSCLYCDMVPEDESCIQGYLSEEDLIKEGWECEKF